jgi:hypothetical protein
MEGPSLQIQEELLLAKQSRIEGNEGRARVCARRAAGAAAQVFLLNEGISYRSENVLDSLQTLISELSLPERVVTAVNWLLQRVDMEHNLPANVDLISEAEIIIEYLGSGYGE